MQLVPEVMFLAATNLDLTSSSAQEKEDISSSIFSASTFEHLQKINFPFLYLEMINIKHPILTLNEMICSYANISDLF